MFKRRKKRKPSHHLREFFWPSLGWKRLVHYYRHRIGRLSGTPYFIAAGLASGVAVSFTPFLGLHMIMAALLALAVRGSLVASAIGTLFGNPWTFTIIFTIQFKVGRMLLTYTGLNKEYPVHFSFSQFVDYPMNYFLPVVIGSIVPAIVSWFVTLYFAQRAIVRYRELRRKARERGIRKRVQKQMQKAMQEQNE